MDPQSIQKQIQQITETASGFMAARVLLTANRLGLFAALGAEGLDAAEAAGRVGADPRACGRVLDVLCALGYLAKADGIYRLRPGMADYFLPGGAQYVGDILGHFDRLWERWSRLTEVVRSGRPVPREEVAGPLETEAARRDFILGMANIGGQSARELAEALAPRGPLRLLDLGGGPGTYAIEFALRDPELQAVVFDLPEVVRIAEEEIRRRGLEGRVSTAAGDYLDEALPGGFDLVLLSNVIHSLGPDDVRRLLRRAGEAARPGGRVVVKDFLVDEERTGPLYPVIFAINMLVGTEAGGTYTAGEIREWLREAGLRPGEELALARHSTVIIGVR